MDTRYTRAKDDGPFNLNDVENTLIYFERLRADDAERTSLDNERIKTEEAEKRKKEYESLKNSKLKKELSPEPIQQELAQSEPLYLR